MSKARDIADSAATINVLDGVTATATELNYVDGVTSAIQTQLDGKETADATIVKDADIGSTVQAYDSNLTSFVGTFTLPTTDGTADQVLTTNGSGTLAFADAGGGAFNFISNTSFTTNTSLIDVTSGFSSTYDDYMVIISGLKCTGGPELYLRLYRNGSIQTNGYYSQRHIMSYQSHSVSAPYTTYMHLGSVGGPDQITSAILYFHNMRDATDARYHNVSWRIYGMPYGPGGSSDVNSATGQGICDRTGSGFFDGFRLYLSTGSMSQASLTFYGISKS